MSLSARDGAGKDQGSGLIPKGQLAFCVITKSELKVSENSGRRYVAMELVVEPNQPYERCHLWHNLMDYTDAGHKPTTKSIAISQVAKILEVGNGASPNNVTGYDIESWDALAGMRCAVKIGIEKGTGSYPDKNSVEFITPNPDSSTSKAYAALQSGVFNQTAGDTSSGQAASQQASFGGAITSPAPQTGAAPGGFGQGKQAQTQSEDPVVQSNSAVSGPGSWS